MPSKEQRVVDAKEACCMDTLSKPIEEALVKTEPGEVIDLLVRPSFRRMVHLLAEETGYSILGELKGEDEIRFRIVGKYVGDARG